MSPRLKPAPGEGWTLGNLLALASLVVTVIGVIVAALVFFIPVAEHKPSEKTEHYDDPVKDACMKGSSVDCQTLAGRVFVNCNSLNPACKLLSQCWQDKARVLMAVDFACNQKPNPESCDLQRKIGRGMLLKDCDKATLGTL